MGRIVKGVAGPVLAVVLVSMSAGQEPVFPYCQILDSVEVPAWRIGGGYVTREAVKAPGISDLGMAEFDVESGLLSLRTKAGNFDLKASALGFVFVDGGGLGLPDLAGSTVVGFQWVGRWANGMSLRADVNPGLYSDWRDISAKDVYAPFGISFIQAFNPQIAGLVGVEIYPEFRRDLDPRIGVRWVPVPEVWLDLFYPESRITFSPDPSWELFGGARMTKTLEYQLRDSDPRRHLIYNENRAFAGVRFQLPNDLRLTAQTGAVFDRVLDFKNGQPVDVEDGLFADVGIGGVF